MAVACCGSVVVWCGSVVVWCGSVVVVWRGGGVAWWCDGVAWWDGVVSQRGCGGMEVTLISPTLTIKVSYTSGHTGLTAVGERCPAKWPYSNIKHASFFNVFF